MGTFHYKGMGVDGRILRGSLTAADRDAATRSLRERGLIPTYVGGTAPFALSWDGRGTRRRGRGVLRFTEEIATLLNAGVPLERALGIATETGEGDAEMARQVRRTLRGGESLAEALAQQPEHFSRLYVNMVRAGEAAGALPQIMDRLAAFERGREELRSDLVSSLVYPVLLLVVGAASVVLLFAYVVPKFATSFLASSLGMPLPMQLLLATSEAMRTWWPAVVTLLGIAALGGLAWARTDSGRVRIDALLLRAPLLGSAVVKAETARFARAMATLLTGTVPLVEALGIARGVLLNRALAAALAPVEHDVQRGESLSRAVERSGALPRLAEHLLVVGEETGQLDRMFDRLADIYARQTRETLKRFTALFEPLVILVLGGVIGAVILSILLALTSVQRMGL